MPRLVLRHLRNLALGAAVGVLAVSPATADDIDVYVAPPAAAQVGETLVVFTLDVRPNVMASTVCTDNECAALFAEVGMSDQLNPNGSTSFFQLLVAVFKKVLYRLDNDKVKVALMIPHADTTGGNKKCVGFNPNPECSNGAYVLSHFRSTGDAVELARFFEKLESIPLKDGGNWSHPYQLKELFFEMYRYITSGKVFNGLNGLDNFGTGNVNKLNINDPYDTQSVHPDHNEDLATGTNLIAELMWDTDAIRPQGVERFYTDTLDDGEHCTNVFSINVTFANASQDNDSNDAMAAPPPEGFGFRPSNSSAGETQVLSYLANTDLAEHLVGKQNIRSYFVTRAGGSANRANDWAQAGGTGSALVFEDDPEELVRLISGLFNEILGVSTTFVAASVPANVFNRAETLNEVYIAVFEPDDLGRPFWPGNLKKLTRTTITETVGTFINDDGEEIAITDDRSILVDVFEADKAEPTSAINPLDGRLRATALTYWTRTGTNNEYLPPPEPDSGEELEFAEGTDGRKVARGGAGQVKPGFLGAGQPGNTNPIGNTTLAGPRKIFTEAVGASATGLRNLDADSLNETAIDLLTDARSYPGKNLSYGDFLFETVMGCVGCAYAGASNTDQSTARQRVNNLIRFARGYDYVDINTATGAKRPWWQADSLHSRPLALNYGARPGYTDERPDIRIVIGGNDGMIQMIRGGRTADGSEDGVEAWAFLPREFVPLQKRLLDGNLGLYLPGRPVADGGEPRTPLHPYGMDGAPTALIIDNNLDGTINPNPPTEADPGDGDDRVYLFFGQRRGGKRYFGIDATDPDHPEFLWSIGPDSADFAEMGQSWSHVRPGIMRIDEGGQVKRRAVAIFSGGYNGDDGGDGVDIGKDRRIAPGPDGIYGTEDDIRVVGTDDPEGNALFIVNALTGELIWKVVGPPNAQSDGTYDPSSNTLKHNALVDSVAATPSLLDSSGDGFIDRIYFPDTGGRVWRLDTAVPDRSEWIITLLFDGGRHYQNDVANDRRFHHSPDIVFAQDVGGKFDAVVLTSGDRPHPLGMDVENWAYMIKDRNTISGVPPTTTLTHADLADLTSNCLQGQSAGELDFTSCEGDAANVEANLPNGWKVRLEQCDAGGTGAQCGEKGLATPLTVEGTIFFTTYLPVAGLNTGQTPETCSPAEGSGLLYALDLQTAGAVLHFTPDHTGDGTKEPDRFDKLASPGIPPNVVAISPSELLRPDLVVQKIPGRRSAATFWYGRRF